MAETLNQGEGWYEFIHVTKTTTHIVHVFENGDVYIPEEGVTYDDFIFAASLGRAYRLVRVQDLESHPLGMDGKTK